jgi:glutathione S-transferase
MVDGAMEPVVVWGMPPMWGIASPSPFALKLETWLRMAGIPYTTKVLAGPVPSKTGKFPFVERPGGETLADSGIIVDTLTRERGVTLDAGLTDAERATAHVVRRTLEESLYFSVAWWRWIDAAGWEVTRESYFGSLPWALRQLVPGIVRNAVRKSIHGQGTGRHEPDHVAALAVADVDAVATLLGDRAWFFGRPTTTDAILYGFFGNVLAAPIPGRVKDAVLARPNLVAHVARVRAAYWAEGE